MTRAEASARYQDPVALIAAAARLAPEALASCCGGEERTWRQLDQGSARVAAALTRGGVAPGERVVILGGTSCAFVEALLGSLRAGACAVPLSHFDTRAGVASKLDDARPAAVLADAERLDWVATRQTPLRLALSGTASGWLELDAVTGPAADAPTPAPRDPDSAFNVIYSSGTTAAAKGIVHSRRMRWFQIERMSRFGFGPQSRTLLSTPLASNATLVALLPTLARGGALVLLPKFSPTAFWQLVEARRVTHALLVPTQVRRLLDEPAISERDLASLQVTFCTGAPTPVADKRQIVARWPGRWVEIFGQTEGGCTTLLDVAARPDKLHTVGQPAAGVEVRILDDRDRPLPSGAIGEVAGRAISMMSGYLARPELTEAATWRDAAGRTFWRTGDLGRLDAEGFLEIVGRQAEVIISGGLNLYPADLEQVLTAHDAVAEAAVIGMPDERWGETAVAAVVPAPGCTPSAAELRGWANERLAPHQRLARVVLVSELPRDSLGKLRRRELRARLAPGA